MKGELQHDLWKGVFKGVHIFQFAYVISFDVGLFQLQALSHYVHN
jgi:hypothetical protein